MIIQHHNESPNSIRVIVIRKRVLLFRRPRPSTFGALYHQNRVLLLWLMTILGHIREACAPKPRFGAEDVCYTYVLCVTNRSSSIQEKQAFFRQGW